MVRHTVDARQPVPLKRYLRGAFPLLPEGMLRRALRQKDVRREGIRLQAEDLVRGGDALEVYIIKEYLYALPEIIHQDDRFIAFVKPRGIPSVGPGSLEEALQALHPAWAACHRLDAQTGGLILFAKDAAAHQAAVDAFAERRVQKIYRALVLGIPSPAQAELRAYLVKDEKAARVRIVERPQPGALSVHTGYETLTVGEGRSELRLQLHTGRTHQIRAQMAHIGHPVLGDDLYGDRQANKRLSARRLMLWASELEVDSPQEVFSPLRGKRLTAEPPWEGGGTPDV